MDHNFPEYTPGERVADGLIHGVGVVASLAAAATLMTVAILYLPPLSTPQHRDLLRRHGGRVRFFGGLSPRCAGRALKAHPAPLRSRGDLREDRRDLHAVCAREAWRRGRLRPAGRGLGRGVVRRRRQAVLAGAARAHLVRSLSRAGVGVRCRLAAAHRGPPRHAL